MSRVISITCLVCVVTIHAVADSQETNASGDATALATRAKEIFRSHCLDCHGGTRTNAGVEILNRQLLVDEGKIAPGEPDESYLIQLITAEDDSRMPPASQTALSAEDVQTIRDWIAADAPDFPGAVERPSPVRPTTPTQSTGRSDSGSGNAANAEKDESATDKDNAPVPDAGDLTADKGDSPTADADKSTSTTENDATQTTGNEYVLGKILDHVRTLKPGDRRFVRYFSINHLATGEVTAEELTLHRAALAKVINHLSWESKIVVPESIDAPADTLYAIDLRKVGWHVTPYEAFDGGLSIGPSPVNLYDLALLEYPYSIVYEDSDVFDRVVEEYLTAAEMVLPIPFVRADWFTSIVTQPVLYADFLQLPSTLAQLENLLEVDSAANIRNGVAKRAGMTVSGVSRNNRVVERHPSRYGYYWKSFDFKSNRGTENILKDPVDFVESGGEMVFSLPNGLNGYYVSDSQNIRLDTAPTEIVVDKFASDRIVRNGLSCIRCHDAGIKGFVDSVRPALLQRPGTTTFNKQRALELYPDHESMQELVKADTAQFLDALQKATDEQQREPLTPVSVRYLDNPITLSVASGELGVTDASDLQAVFRAPALGSIGLLPLAGDGVVRRDAWEEHFDQVVRSLGLGTTVVPLDGVLRRDFPATNPPVAVDLATNKKNNVFEPGDELRITIANRSEKTVFVELIGLSATGQVAVLVNPKTKIEPGTNLQFPDSESAPIKIRGGLGKEQIVLFASDAEFSAGQTLKGKNVSDRFVHRLQTLERKDGRTVVAGDPSRIVKRTLEIATQ